MARKLFFMLYNSSVREKMGGNFQYFKLSKFNSCLSYRNATRKRKEMIRNTEKKKRIKKVGNIIDVTREKEKKTKRWKGRERPAELKGSFVTARLKS